MQRTLPMLIILALVWAGCATGPKVNWESRVGHYSYDQAVLELGPPDKLAQLSDGAKVAEWLTQKGMSHGSFYPGGSRWVQHYSESPSPDYFLRLSFDPKGQLTAWRKVMK